MSKLLDIIHTLPAIADHWGPIITMYSPHLYICEKNYMYQKLAVFENVCIYFTNQLLQWYSAQSQKIIHHMLIHLLR